MVVRMLMLSKFIRCVIRNLVLIYYSSYLMNNFTKTNIPSNTHM